MGYTRYTPPAPLNRFVEVIWTFEGDGSGPHRKERLLPDGSTELVVNLHETKIPVYQHEDVNKCEIFQGSVVCGPHSRSFVIDTATQVQIAGVHFKPGGAHPFLKLPSGELHNMHVGLDDLWGRDARELRERLLEAKTSAAKAQVLQQMLMAKAADTLGRHPAVSLALNEFHGSPEVSKISTVTERVGLSAKHFIDVFRDEVGLTPKLFCRVRRFQKVLRHISKGRAVDWTELALACGYFDQAHFIHDFRGFSGINPSSYLADHTEHFNHVPIRG
jgi:AraC-like DNA-binding protein